MAESFTYDAKMVEDILSKVNLPNQFLQVPTHELGIRDYERINSHELHCSTLTEYFKCTRIPRGLRSNLRPTLFSDNKEFCKRFEGILNKCSLDLMILTIEFLQQSIEEKTKQLQVIEEQLTATLKSDDWKIAKEKVQKSSEDYRRNTELRKRQKFLRDTEDYQYKRVYRWQEGHQMGRNQDRYRYEYGSGSSGSDSAGSAYGPYFLGPGRPRGRRPTRARGGAGGVGREEPRMYTRSQVMTTW